MFLANCSMSLADWRCIVRGSSASSPRWRRKSLSSAVGIRTQPTTPPPRGRRRRRLWGGGGGRASWNSVAERGRNCPHLVTTRWVPDRQPTSETVWGSGCIEPRFFDLGTSWRLVKRYLKTVQVSAYSDWWLMDLLIIRVSFRQNVKMSLGLIN
jgi:hypothetical protein